MEEKEYSVSEAVRLIGVESHVLRYWEEELHVPVGRSTQGHRMYSERDIALFRRTKELKDCGIQLKAIRLLFEGEERLKDQNDGSEEKEEQENSLENQITYYKNKIENTPNWTLVDIFADFGISGMNDKNRIEFQRMIEMCNKGKIDLIITKSISRFARNTVDCLTHVRKLKANNIGVIFEKEGINTLDAVSETFLIWFSAFAQAESESLSQNVTRGKRMGYKEGKFAFPSLLYGYDRGDGKTPVIIPEQAAIVRKIFHMYLEGNSIGGIRKWLNDNNIETTRGTGE